MLRTKSFFLSKRKNELNEEKKGRGQILNNQNLIALNYTVKNTRWRNKTVPCSVEAL